MHVHPLQHISPQSISYGVPFDEACASIFPLLIAQLETVDRQLIEGVATLIEGFSALSMSIGSLDLSFQNESQESPAQIGKARDLLARIDRFATDLLAVGDNIHDTIVDNATDENISPATNKHMSRVILHALGAQHTASEIRYQAVEVSELIDELANQSVLTRSVDDIKMISDLQVEVNKMIVAFQFQDRVCQIIHSVINSVKDLGDYIREASMTARLDGREPLLNIAEMRERIESYYISKEQHEMGSSGGETSTQDITFFQGAFD